MGSCPICQRCAAVSGWIETRVIGGVHCRRRLWGRLSGALIDSAGGQAGILELAGPVDGAGQSEQLRLFAETEHPVEVVPLNIPPL
jgi:hypothetical protein